MVGDLVEVLGKMMLAMGTCAGNCGAGWFLNHECLPSCLIFSSWDTRSVDVF